MVALPALAGELELGVLAALPLFDGALDREGQLHHQAGHVGLDLVQVLLAKVLDGVTHGVGLKHRHPLETKQKPGLEEMGFGIVSNISKKLKKIIRRDKLLTPPEGEPGERDTGRKISMQLGHWYWDNWN